MTTLTNANGDTVEVTLGGFGGDNVLGGVTDSQGAPISNARVVVSNVTNGQQAIEDPTGNDGEYDVDVDASAGDKVFVHAEWVDGNGRTHVVTGFVTLTAPAAIIETAEIEKLIKLEETARIKAAAQATKGLPSDDHYAASDAVLTGILNGLIDKGDDEQKTVIDKLMRAEVLRLLIKIRSARGRPRNDSDVWSAIEELLAMILKLYFKALILQGRGIEPLPEPGPQPQPQPGPQPVPGPDLT